MSRLFFILLFLCVAGSEAHAHSKSLSFSDWQWQGASITLSFSVPDRDITLLPSVTQKGLALALQDHLNQSIKIEPCINETGFTPHPAHNGYHTMRAKFICPDNTKSIQIHNHAFFNHAASHVHFARLRADDNDRGEEVLFTATARSFTLTQQDNKIVASNRAVFSTYLWLGITHIMGGVDHIAFLLCLLLLAVNTRQTIFLITGFTIGHSLTLALTALDIAIPNSAVVEAIIGFTIALVAAETILARQNLMPRAGIILAGILAGLAIIGGNLPLLGWAGLIIFTLCYGLLIRNTGDSLRFAPLMTLLFGAVHGFGFGGVLSTIGLPPTQIIQALFGFNLGVEIGQIAILIAIISSVHLVSRFMPNISTPLAIKDIAACTLAAYGVFLFAQRGLF